MATHETVLRAVKSAVADKATETGGRNAVARVLASYGYIGMPIIETGRDDSGATVRVYTWTDTPAGDILMIGGPSLENEIHDATRLGYKAAPAGSYIQMGGLSKTAASKLTSGMKRAQGAGAKAVAPKPRKAPRKAAPKKRAPAKSMKAPTEDEQIRDQIDSLLDKADTILTGYHHTYKEGSNTVEENADVLERAWPYLAEAKELCEKHFSWQSSDEKPRAYVSYAIEKWEKKQHNHNRRLERLEREAEEAEEAEGEQETVPFDYETPDYDLPDYEVPRGQQQHPADVYEPVGGFAEPEDDKDARLMAQFQQLLAGLKTAKQNPQLW